MQRDEIALAKVIAREPGTDISHGTRRDVGTHDHRISTLPKWYIESHTEPCFEDLTTSFQYTGLPHGILHRPLPNPVCVLVKGSAHVRMADLIQCIRGVSSN
jgi:hypothetical protein